MLIIFDLDDTLIQTSKAVQEHARQKIVESLNERSFDLNDVSSFLDNSLRFSSSTSEGILDFFELIGEKETTRAKHTLSVIHEAVLDSIQLTPDVGELLSLLAHKHTLTIVTQGDEAFQKAKMQKAGIPIHLFAKVMVVPKNKEKAYKCLVDELRISPRNVYVCGDRIQTDLTPAKRLGMNTVHFRQGRGLGNTGRKKDIDYTILHLKELFSLLPT